MDLLAGEHLGQGVVIFSSDLGKDSPVGMSEEVHKKHAGGGESLADGLGLPLFLELYEEEVVAQLRLGDVDRITAQVLVDEPELAVIRVPGSIGVIAQGQVLGKPGHRGEGMLVIDGVGKVSRCGPNGLEGLGSPEVWRVGVRVGGGGMECIIGAFHAPQS